MPVVIKNNYNYVNKPSNSKTIKDTASIRESSIFVKAVKEAETLKVTDIDNTRSENKKNMSFEEYKRYIDIEISKLSMKFFMMGRTLSVYITEEGYKAMQNDQEYEKWVLDTLKNDAADNYFMFNSCMKLQTTHQFGATKEEYSGQSWFERCNKRSCWVHNDYYVRKINREKKIAKKKFLEKQYKKYLEHIRLEKKHYERLLEHKRYMRSVMANQAAEAYEANLLIRTKK